MVLHRTNAIAAWALVAAASCGGDGSSATSEGEVSRSWNPAAVTNIEGVPVADFRRELERQLARRPGRFSEEQWRRTKRLYSAFSNAPLWLDEDGLIERRGRDMVDALVNATTDGLRIDAYPLLELASLLAEIDTADAPTAERLAQTDLLLSASYASLAEDYLTGQVDPRSVAQSWHIDTRDEEVDSALVRSLRDRDVAGAIARMRPQDYDYDMLRRKLVDYRKIVSGGGWPAVPAGKALKRGDREAPARLAALRARLRVEGYTVSDTGTTFDHTLASAIARFQERHAIVVDSMLGTETLDALNKPAEYRLAQITANLERYRWLPRTMGNRYVFVNVPAFRLQAFDSGRKVLEMKVIVGAEYDGRSTPVFSDRMEFVVFRPYWNVTDDIAANELFPKFARTGMPADYETYMEGGKLRLRQKPGEKNSLGLVKFMFPNDFNIYLHDTPDDDLFEQDVRAFSHGCIRVEEPEELAQWVLGWSHERVEQAMHGANNRTVNLPNKIPVYIAYFTAYVKDGHLFFGNDLYQRDEPLAHAVLGGAMPSGEAVRGVEALRRLTD